MSNVRFIGLDVHAETIAVAVADGDTDVRSPGTIPNRPESIRKLVKKLGATEQLRVCYEAGRTGYVVYWQLTALGVKCEVVAPTLVPVKAGDRVKTDRRDAMKLARSYRAGDLTAVWVPDAEHEALGIWCELEKPPRRISCARGTVWFARLRRDRPDGPGADRPLTARRRRFIEEYLIDLNGAPRRPRALALSATLGPTVPVLQH